MCRSRADDVRQSLPMFRSRADNVRQSFLCVAVEPMMSDNHSLCVVVGPMMSDKHSLCFLVEPRMSDNHSLCVAVEPMMRRIASRIPNNKEVCTKAKLASRMAKYAGRLGQPCRFIPESHMVSAKLQITREREQLQRAADCAVTEGRGSVWIVKPDARNRWIGITVHSGIGANQPVPLSASFFKIKLNVCWILWSRKYFYR